MITISFYKTIIQIKKYSFKVIFIALALLQLHCAPSVSEPQGSTPIDLVEKEESSLQQLSISHSECDTLSLEDCAKLLLDQWEIELDDITQNLACDNTDQCKSVALGKRACGGPEAYLIYSEKQIESEEVERISNGYNILVQLIKETFNPDSSLSICSIELKPLLKCQENLCVITER